jgi:hypothetical protein
MKTILFFVMLVISVTPVGPSPSPRASKLAEAPSSEASVRGQWEKRWVYVSANLYADETIPRLREVLRRAADAGYNGVLFSDPKTLTWWTLDRPDRWKANAAALRTMTRELGLELVVCVFPFGYAEALLARDPNLAAGMPIREAPLVRRADRLIPEQTAAITNGSFEEYRGDRAAAFTLQDSPGKGSFIDTAVFKDGRASIRFENVGSANRHGLGRVFQKIAVEPWQQYRIRVWMKTERLSADMLQVIALGGRRPLQFQSLVVPAANGLEYVSTARELTTDWVEQTATFNSLDNTTVTIGVGEWGGTTGTIWWDGLRIEAVPTLNLLRRDALPLVIVGRDGTAYREGVDFDRIADPGMGMYLWPGTYDTRHDPPSITIPAGSRIAEGERVGLSCYHTVIFYGGQVCASLDDPEVFELCGEEMRRTEEALAPDGYFMSHDEIRCAGWEPSQLATFRTSGELFAFNIRKCFDIAHSEGEGKPVYVWSDMYDPYHNARVDFYLVNNTTVGSWEGLDPRVTVMKWGLARQAAPSISFFRGRGNALMIAAYYDGNVEEDRRAWKSAASARGVIGVMYTTWENDYADLESFARAWWGSR